RSETGEDPEGGQDQYDFGEHFGHSDRLLGACRPMETEQVEPQIQAHNTQVGIKGFWANASARLDLVHRADRDAGSFGHLGDGQAQTLPGLTKAGAKLCEAILQC
ncbi:MAG: hypothetical protein AAFV53_13060, partial [Myxococcota bacterium]